MTNFTTDQIQLEVAQSNVNSRNLVLAGPGTGKTQTVAMRLAHLLGSGIGPAQILVLSFSRSAVKTLVRRLENFATNEVADLTELRHISIRTFDSWSFRILRRLGFLPRDLLMGTHDANISRLVDEIRSGRREEIRAMLGNIRHVIVDEFQDLAGIRGNLVLELLQLLSPPDSAGSGFTILGDEAQAIYGFSLRDPDGDLVSDLSSAELLASLRSIYGDTLQTYELRINHRAAPSLAFISLSLRNILTRNISGDKKLAAMRLFMKRVPEIGTDLDPDNIAGLSDDTAAILTRTNGEAIRLYKRLMGISEYPPATQITLRAGSRIPPVPAWVGATLGRYPGIILTRTQFSKIYQHLYPTQDEHHRQQTGIPEEEDAWKLLVLASDAGAGTTSISLQDLRNRLDWADLFPDDDNTPAGTIQIMTVHQSKGMEFGAVTVLEHSVNDEREADLTPHAAAEEASVIFVALTRAGKILKRIPIGANLYPLTLRSFNGGTRKRWDYWRNGWINMEMGIAGDVSATGFVDLRIHESKEKVAELQEFLALNVAGLRGRKIVLCKMHLPDSDNKFVYGIHLQEYSKSARLLGITSEQLTYDLLSRVWDHGYALPSKIMNLRIMDVVTMGLDGAANEGVAPQWASSGLWLGVNIYGTGDFKPFKRNGK